MAIKIKTRLHDGIYASQGGGQTIAHYTFNTGPRNLVRAINLLRQHQTDLVDAYGNIGAGQSWIEVDGTIVDPYDGMSIVSGYSGQSATDMAKEFLEGEAT